jgi:hypothetical protein
MKGKPWPTGLLMIMLALVLAVLSCQPGEPVPLGLLGKSA